MLRAEKGYNHSLLIFPPNLSETMRVFPGN